jgi:nitrilase
VSLGDSPDAIIMRGGSAIVSPLGKVLAGPSFEGETILTAELDLNEIGRGKFDFDVAGHYSRPDVFQLVVNERPMPAVVAKS